MSIAANLTPDQSQQLIYQVIRNAGIPDPLAFFVVAQSGHETNGWTSPVYLADNNAFGYGFNGSSYKQYDTVEESATDIVGYINRRVNDGSFPDLSTITTADQYATLLKNAKSGAYYGDTESNYSAGISRWFDDNLKLIAGGSVAILIFGIFLFVLLNSKGR